MTPPLRLRPADLRLLARTAVLLVAFDVLKRTGSLPRLARAFERAPRRAGTPDVARLVRLVQGVLRRVYRRDFCLPQSLILFHFLSGWDQPVRLCLGVRKAGHGISGHAWIELDGRPLAERRDPREAYHVTFTHPNPSERSSYEERRTRYAAPRRAAPPGARPPQALHRADAGAAREAA